MKKTQGNSHKWLLNGGR